MSDHYSSYADAPDMPVLDSDALNLTAEHMTVVRTLLADPTVNPDLIAVRAAHVYDRKGYYSTDNFAGNPNPSYRGLRDDIIVQVTLVIRGDRADGAYGALTDIYADVQDAKAAAEVTERQAAADQAQADLDAAKARLAAAQAKVADAQARAGRA